MPLSIFPLLALHFVCFSFTLAGISTRDRSLVLYEADDDKDGGLAKTLSDHAAPLFQYVPPGSIHVPLTLRGEVGAVHEAQIAERKARFEERMRDWEERRKAWQEAAVKEQQEARRRLEEARAAATAAVAGSADGTSGEIFLFVKSRTGDRILQGLRPESTVAEVLSKINVLVGKDQVSKAAPLECRGHLST